MELESELVQAECSQRSVPRSPRVLHRSNSNVSQSSSNGHRRHRIKDSSKSYDYSALEERLSPRDEIDVILNNKQLMSPRLQGAPEDDLLGSTKALANEIEKMRQQKLRKKRAKSHYTREEVRESSGISRDSGVMSTDYEASPKHNKTRGQRPTSGTSTLSNMSDIDSFSLSEEANPNDGKTYVIGRKGECGEVGLSKTKNSNIRQVSAPKKKKKREFISDYDHVRNLLRTPDD